MHHHPVILPVEKSSSPRRCVSSENFVLFACQSYIFSAVEPRLLSLLAAWTLSHNPWSCKIKHTVWVKHACMDLNFCPLAILAFEALQPRIKLIVIPNRK